MERTIHEVHVRPDGSYLFIYDDELRFLGETGLMSIERASHVEPTSDGRWTADLSPGFPMTGPVLGPFATRREALDAERAWINQALGEGATR